MPRNSSSGTCTPRACTTSSCSTWPAAATRSPPSCWTATGPQPHTLNADLVRIFTGVYDDPEHQWDVYETCEELVDIEDTFQTWRFRHLKTVERIIGYKRGTGGSTGVAFLRRALSLTFFPELFAVRTEIGQPTGRSKGTRHDQHRSPDSSTADRGARRWTPADPLAAFRDRYLPQTDDVVAYLDGNSLGRPLASIARSWHDFATRAVGGPADPRLVGGLDGAAGDRRRRTGGRRPRRARRARRSSPIPPPSTSTSRCGPR